jgi:hypothetical protein
MEYGSTPFYCIRNTRLSDPPVKCTMGDADDAEGHPLVRVEFPEGAEYVPLIEFIQRFSPYFPGASFPVFPGAPFPG